MIDIIVVYILVTLSVLFTLSNFILSSPKFTKREQIHYLYLLLSLGLWVIANVLSDVPKNYPLALFGARIAILFTPHLSAAIYLLATIFPQKVKADLFSTFTRHLVLASTLFITVVFMILLDTQYNIVNFRINFDGPNLYEPGLIYPIVYIYSIFIIGLALFHWRIHRDNYTWLQRQQISALSLSIGVVLLSVLFGLIVFPAFGVVQYSPLSLLPLVYFEFQVQQHLINKEILVNTKRLYLQNIVFVILGILIFSFLLLLNYLLAHGLTLFPAFISVMVLYAVFHALTVRFLSRFSDSKSGKETASFVESSTTLYELKDVLTQLEQTITRIIPGSMVSIVLKRDIAKAVEKSILTLWQDQKNATILTIEHLLSELTKQKKKAKRLLYKDVVEKLINSNIQLVIPLNKRVSLQGMIFVQNPQFSIDQDTYSALETLSHNGSVAISRAILYQEIKDLNSELELKVKTRTETLAEAKETLQERNNQLKTAFKELKTLDDAKSEFISISSHQLRTPISIIRGYLSMIIEGDFGKLSNEAKGAISKAANSIQQLNDIVEDILNASRIERGKLVLSPENTDVVALVSAVIETLQTKAEAKGLTLSFNTEPQKFIARMDKNKIYEVISNLVDNAINYTQKGRITVNCAIDSNSKNAIIVSIKDTGIGIPSSFKDKIYQRFSRSDNAQEIRPDGTGIGLYVAKSFIEAHHGSLWFESKLNKGTTFYIKILSDPVFELDFNTKQSAPQEKK